MSEFNITYGLQDEFNFAYSLQDEFNFVYSLQDEFNFNYKLADLYTDPATGQTRLFQGGFFNPNGVFVRSGAWDS